jgi:hypothetical protein
MAESTTHRKSEEPLKLYTQYTPAHEILFSEYFQPSLPVGVHLIAQTFPLEGPGDYCSREWHGCIQQKIHLLIEAITENMGSQIVWSDVDIQFYDFSPTELLTLLDESGRDILFQRESRFAGQDVNTGFFIARCNEKTLAFFRQLAGALRSQAAPNDQHTTNDLLRASTPVSWQFLPPKYYARTHGFPPPRHLALHHANYTHTVHEKCRQLDRVRNMTCGNFLNYLQGLVSELVDLGPLRLLRATIRRVIGR